MKRNILSSLPLLLVLPALSLSLASCGKKSEGASSENQTRKILVSYFPDNPWCYVDDNGKAAGYEIEVLREVDKLLDQYEFVYEVAPEHPSMLISVETGKAQIGVNGLFYNPERAKRFLYPEQPSGANITGLIISSDFGKDVETLRDFSLKGGRIAPVAPNVGTWGTISEWNEKNPDAQIKLIPAEVFDKTIDITGVLQNQWEGTANNISFYEYGFNNPEGPYHQYKDKFKFIPWKGIRTWFVFTKSETELAAAYDEAFKTLYESGKIGELSERYFGLNTFDYVQD